MFLRQLLSVAVQGGNAYCVLGTFSQENVQIEPLRRTTIQVSKDNSANCHNWHFYLYLYLFSVRTRYNFNLFD
jgi:hypothetical protein